MSRASPHYSPAASVRLISAADLPHLAGESSDGHQATIGLLATATIATPAGIVRLAAPETSDEYARVLYSVLREADALGLQAVLAIAPHEAGVGAAVIDRLTRAAHSE